MAQRVSQEDTCVQIHIHAHAHTRARAVTYIHMYVYMYVFKGKQIPQQNKRCFQAIP